MQGFYRHSDPLYLGLPSMFDPNSQFSFQGEIIQVIYKATVGFY